MNGINLTRLVQTLSILCADDTIADLMNATLSAEEDERLTNDQMDIAEELFSMLTAIRPDCIPIAQNQGGVLPKKDTKTITINATITLENNNA